MFKTIFSKLVAIFVLILLVAFSVTGIMLNIFLGNYVTEDKAFSLEKSCDNINLAFSNFIQMKSIDKTFAQKYLTDYVQAYGDSYRAMIWIVDSEGHIQYSSTELPEEVSTKYEDDTGLVKLPDERQYKEVMEAAGTVRVIGDFYGFFKLEGFDEHYNKDSWLTVEKSYEYKDAQGNPILVGIYMHTSVPEANRARTELFKLFLISVGAAVIISVILIYIFSLRLSRPLKQIKNAARVIADGEFSKRLDIKSKDEIGELAKTFNQMTVALQNLEEMRRGFIANVSHELRTPMTSIRGFIDGILDGTIPPERQEYYLTVVKDETIRLNRLVNNLLDLARMEAGEVQMNIRPIEINELARRCIIKLESLLLEKRIMIEAKFDKESIYVNADADAIERVLYNLIHNAIKFSPEESTIKIIIAEQKNKVQITVEDQGIGIDSEEKDMIWDRFYKSDKSRSNDKTGTGLGLAIVRNIIHEHGQEIWVDSEAGTGTSFTFTLDVTEPVQPQS
ncbi:MAG: cell wall metabolism sensor histidine kinase WalK [Clostridiales bacterium]|nr:cell wall metabolism sensor histidine kinase WalK [Clostridiales bacterium]